MEVSNYFSLMTLMTDYEHEGFTVMVMFFAFLYILKTTYQHDRPIKDVKEQLILDQSSTSLLWF